MKKTFGIIFFIMAMILGQVEKSIAQRPAGYGGREAPANGSLQGRLSDKTKQVAIPYATVVLYRYRDSSLVTGTMSGNDGSFVLDKLKPGRYYLIAKFIGYRKDTIKNIKLRPPNMSINLGTIYLTAAAQALQGVEITSERSYVEYKIDRKVVNVGKDLNATGGTAVQALENVPSVTVDIDDNVQLRGSSSFTVLINGKPTPLAGSDALQQIPVDVIKNIEIITNPSAKYDPDGMTGIINVVLKDHIKQGINGIVDVSLSSFGQYTTNANFSYNTGKFTFYLGGNYSHRVSPGKAHSELSNYFSDTSYRITDLDRTRRRPGYSVMGGFDFQADKNNLFTLEGSYNYFGHNKDFSSRIHEYNSPMSYDNYFLSYNPGKREGHFAKMTANWKLNLDKQGSNIQTYVYYGTGSEVEDDLSLEYIADALWNKGDSIVEGNHTNEIEKTPDIRLKSDFTKNYGKDQRLEAGLQARFRPEYHEIQLEQLDTSNQWINLPEYGSTLNFIRNIYSGYATYSGMYKTLGYQFGLRGEHTYRNVYDKSKDYTFVINRFDLFPTLHLSKKFKNKNQLLLSYSRRIDRPGGWELEPSIRYISSNFMRQGNPELQPEYMDNFELSYEKVVNQSFFSAEAYYHNTKNKITRLQSIDSTGMLLMTFDNLDRDQAAGIELMFNLRLVKWLNINISGNYYYYRLLGSSEELGPVDNTSNNFDMRGNIDIRMTKNTRLQIRGFYRGASVTAQGHRSPFFVTSASIRQDFFKRKLALTFRVRDIFQTMRFQFTTEGENFYNDIEYSRRSPVFTLNLSYKINNYEEKRRRRGEDEMEGGGEGEI